MADANNERRGSNGFVGRVRTASLSLRDARPQLSMWQASGTAIAQAPNLTELRDVDSGADNIAFDARGHSTRIAVREPDGELTLAKTNTRQLTLRSIGESGNADEEEGDQKKKVDKDDRQQDLLITDDEDRELRERALRSKGRQMSLHEKHMANTKEGWGPTIKNGLKAFWKFFLTPWGFLIIIYFLNIVAWGAMLFFLLLKAAPAMNHPSADDDNSPRKKWLEIDSQILNALFCVTAFGLAPWRFRDMYRFIRARFFGDKIALAKLSDQNKAWFRPAGLDTDDKPTTFTGQIAPPTAMWKLGFSISMMVLNTFLQVVLCYFMWAYNRINRPTWATGTFIALGCGSSMLAGLMSWWEGRKVKKIEGPEVKIVNEEKV